MKQRYQELTRTRLIFFQWWRGEGTCSNAGWRKEKEKAAEKAEREVKAAEKAEREGKAVIPEEKVGGKVISRKEGGGDSGRT